MSREINGAVYYSSDELLPELKISRQTLWRWRREGKIPEGHRFRDGKLLFEESEVEEIRRYANRLEPITYLDRSQLSLFEE